MIYEDEKKSICRMVIPVLAPHTRVQALKRFGVQANGTTIRRTQGVARAGAASAAFPRW